MVLGLWEESQGQGQGPFSLALQEWVLEAAPSVAQGPEGGAPSEELEALEAQLGFGPLEVEEQRDCQLEGQQEQEALEEDQQEEHQSEAVQLGLGVWLGLWPQPFDAFQVFPIQ